MSKKAVISVVVCLFAAMANIPFFPNKINVVSFLWCLEAACFILGNNLVKR